MCLVRAWEGRLRPRTSVDEMNHIYYISLLMAYLSELTKATASDVIRADAVPTRLDSQVDW
jgi:hypothetical protein